MAQYDNAGNQPDEKIKNLVDWLRDAHAMEQQAETMLRKQADRIQNYPELKARIEQHITETQNQASLVDSCLKRYNASSSGIKDMGAKIMAFGQSVGGALMSDEIMKGVQASYVFEHMEIASYTMLIAAAESVGDTETKDICERIIKEEYAMAEWLHDFMPKLTLQFQARAAEPGVDAKR